MATRAPDQRENGVGPLLAVGAGAAMFLGGLTLVLTDANKAVADLAVRVPGWENWAGPEIGSLFLFAGTAFIGAIVVAAGVQMARRQRV